MNPDYAQGTLVKQLEDRGVERVPIKNLLMAGIENYERIPPSRIHIDVKAELEKILETEPWIPDPDSIEIEDIFENDAEFIRALILDCCSKAVEICEENDDKDDTIDEIVDQYLDNLDFEDTETSVSKMVKINQNENKVQVEAVKAKVVIVVDNLDTNEDPFAKVVEKSIASKTQEIIETNRSS